MHLEDLDVGLRKEDRLVLLVNPHLPIWDYVKIAVRVKHAELQTSELLRAAFKSL